MQDSVTSVTNQNLLLREHGLTYGILGKKLTMWWSMVVLFMLSHLHWWTATVMDTTVPNVLQKNPRGIHELKILIMDDHGQDCATDLSQSLIVLLFAEQFLIWFM
jgi:hypothetical protein